MDREFQTSAPACSLPQRIKGSLPAILLAVVVVVSVWVLGGLVQGGMLRPNFGRIHAAYDYVFFWLPVMLYGVAGVALAGLRWRRRHAYWAALCCCLASGLIGLRHYVTYVEPERLVVHAIEIVTDKVSAPLRILHVTDTHFPEWGDYEERVMATIAAQGVDIILHTGDFTQPVPPAEFAEIWSAFTRRAAEIEPRYGIWGVFGDTDIDVMRVPLPQRAPIRFLSSAGAMVETHAGTIHLHGLNLTQSRYPEWGERSVRGWLAGSPATAYRILLGHAPDISMVLTDAPLDLILAGHTHGGQVRLPGFGPLIIDSDVPKEWAWGFRRIGKPLLNVSAGAGSNRHQGLPPIRFRCPTEMTVITLLPAGADG